MYRSLWLYSELFYSLQEILNGCFIVHTVINRGCPVFQNDLFQTAQDIMAVIFTDDRIRLFH